MWIETDALMVFQRATFLGPGDRIGLAGDVGRLALELAMAGEACRVERPVVEGGTDRAAGLAVVPAVAELAALGELPDVGEGALQAVGGAGDAE